jgi:HAD superfamily hydrolase (TIGR01509 family)
VDARGDSTLAGGEGAGPIEAAAILIDMDGLLLDTERLAQRCWEEVQDATGHRMPEGFYFNLIGLSLRAIEERLHAVMPEECDVPGLIAEAAAAYDRALEEEAIPVKAGAEALLAYLEREGVPRCLATSTFGELAERKLRAAGLASYLPYRVCGDDVHESKPAPEIYERAAALLHRAPGECIALEDSENGLRAALAVGCKVLHVPDLAPVSDEVRASVAAEYADLGAVLAAIRKGEVRVGGA